MRVFSYLLFVYHKCIEKDPIKPNDFGISDQVLWILCSITASCLIQPKQSVMRDIISAPYPGWTYSVPKPYILRRGARGGEKKIVGSKTGSGTSL